MTNNYIDRTQELLNLEGRIASLRASIAIDLASQHAYLILSDSDAQAVRHVATVHRPYDVELNLDQRCELLRELDHFNTVMKRRSIALSNASN
jgi:hypothetical protein